MISASQKLSTSIIKSSNKKSLLLLILTDSLVLFTIKTFWSDLQISNASSTIFLRFKIFSPLNEPSEVIIILLLQSSILVAKALDEKPAKTTEWIAPILAQARTENANSGIIGK